MTTKIALTDRVLEFYIPEEKTEFYKCTICKPYKRISGKKKFNLVSHIRSCHPHLIENSDENELELEKEKLHIVQSLSEIVTVNGRPFKSLLWIQVCYDLFEKIWSGLRNRVMESF